MTILERIKSFFGFGKKKVNKNVGLFVTTNKDIIGRPWPYPQKKVMVKGPSLTRRGITLDYQGETLCEVQHVDDSIIEDIVYSSLPTFEVDGPITESITSPQESIFWNPPSEPEQPIQIDESDLVDSTPTVQTSSYSAPEPSYDNSSSYSSYDNGSSSYDSGSSCDCSGSGDF